MRSTLRAVAITALALALPLALAAEEGKPASEAKPGTTETAKTAPAPKKEAAPAAKPEASPAKAAEAASKPHPVVVMKTSLGEIQIELDPEKAPISTENFLKYVADKFYDGTIFHRVIPTFMIQGGGFTADMTQKKTNPPIKLEAQNGLTNKRGTIAMARTADPNSATSQFFINVVDNANLDYPHPDNNGYAVFGKVIAGMDVVDKIKAVATATKGPHQNVPVTPVTIESVRLK